MNRTLQARAVRAWVVRRRGSHTACIQRDARRSIDGVERERCVVGRKRACLQLAVAAVRDVALLPAQPVPAERGSLDLVGLVAARAKTASLAAGGGKPAKLAVLVDSGADPVHLRVVADDNVGRVDENDLEVFVRRVLVHPVAVEHAEVAADAADALFCERAKVAGELQLRDTLVLRLTEDDALPVRALAAAAAHCCHVDHVALLGLVSEVARFLRARRSCNAVDLRQAAVLPSADAQHEAHRVGLLLPPHLLEVLVGSHSGRETNGRVEM